MAVAQQPTLLSLMISKDEKSTYVLICLLSFQFFFLRIICLWLHDIILQPQNVFLLLLLSALFLTFYCFQISLPIQPIPTLDVWDLFPFNE